MKAVIKTLATPLASAAFFISAVTGVLLFFEIEIGLVEPAHKWLSWLLLSGILVHILLHWKQFTGYLSSKPALAVIGGGMLMTVLALYPGFGEKEEEGRENLGKITSHALTSSSLETVALVVNKSPENLIDNLAGKGITVKNQSLTIQEIARQNGKSDKALLGELLAEVKGAEKTGKDRD